MDEHFGLSSMIYLLKNGDFSKQTVTNSERPWLWLPSNSGIFQRFAYDAHSSRVAQQKLMGKGSSSSPKLARQLLF